MAYVLAVLLSIQQRNKLPLASTESNPDSAACSQNRIDQYNFSISSILFYWQARIKLGWNLPLSLILLSTFHIMFYHKVFFFFFAERSGVKAAYKIESAESKVVDSLRDHCTYNPDAQNNPHLYSRVVNLMPELDSLSQLLISRLQQALLDHDITVPSQLSLLFPKQRQSLVLIGSNNQSWMMIV